MNRPALWEYGYEHSGRTCRYQLSLRTTACSCAEGSLALYCGGCNPACGGFSTLDLNPLSPQLNDVLCDINGLALDIPAAGTCGEPIAGMPDLVPLVWQNKKTMPNSASGPLAIRPRDVFRVRRSAKGLDCSPVMDVRGVLHLPEDARLWLAPGAKDHVLEWMWSHPATCIDVLAANHFELVASPNFSVYGDQCSVVWAVNAKRSPIAAYEFAGVCGTAVPTISLPNKFFAQRWAEWLAGNESVSVVAINAQMWRGSSEFETMMLLVADMDRLVPQPIHYVVFGPSAVWKIVRARQILASCTVVSSYIFNNRDHSENVSCVPLRPMRREVS